jgi:Hsp70 protein
LVNPTTSGTSGRGESPLATVPYAAGVSGFRLGIDYGTSNTVAVLRWPDGRTRPLLFDSSPLLPSAVYLTPEGALLCGRDAQHSTRLDPTRYEPNPKRHIGEGSLLLGGHDVPLVRAIAATLARVRDEAVRTAGPAPLEVTITYPAAWAALRRGVLVEAATLAGLPAPTLVPEPVAASAYFATMLGHRVAPGNVVVVYDMGAGTLDVSAVRPTPTGFEVGAVDGLPDFGGLDLDALVVEQARPAVDDATWQRLTAPTDPADRRYFRALWDDARTAKEMLSRTTSASLPLPLVDRDAVVSRESFEAAARPRLTRAAQLTTSVLTRAGAPVDALAGLFLVGGSSRVPMVATVLHHVTGIAPTVLEQPELVVAEGALHAAPRQLAAAPASPPFAAPIPPAVPPAPAPPVSPAAYATPTPPAGPPDSAAPVSPAYAPQVPTPRPAAERRRWVLPAVAGAVALVLLVVIGILASLNGKGNLNNAGGGASAGASASATASPSPTGTPALFTTTPSPASLLTTSEVSKYVSPIAWSGKDTYRAEGAGDDILVPAYVWGDDKNLKDSAQLWIAVRRYSQTYPTCVDNATGLLDTLGYYGDDESVQIPGVDDAVVDDLHTKVGMQWANLVVIINYVGHSSASKATLEAIARLVAAHVAKLPRHG